MDESLCNSFHVFSEVKITSPNPKKGDYLVAGIRYCLNCDYVENVYKDVWDGDFYSCLWARCSQNKVTAILNQKIE